MMLVVIGVVDVGDISHGVGTISIGVVSTQVGVDGRDSMIVSFVEGELERVFKVFVVKELGEPVILVAYLVIFSREG